MTKRRRKNQATNEVLSLEERRLAVAGLIGLEAGKRAEALKKEGWRLSDHLQPEDWRAQHGELADRIADGQSVAIQRVATPVLQLLWQRGSLTPSQYVAGCWLYRDHACGVLGVRAASGGGGGGDPWSVGYAEAQILAAEAYRLALAALGPRLAPWVLPVVLSDSTVKQVAARMQERQEGAAALLRLGLDVLADHYAAGRGRRAREVPDT